MSEGNETVINKTEKINDSELKEVAGGITLNCTEHIVESLGMRIHEAFMFFKPLIDAAKTSNDSQTVAAAERFENILRTGSIDVMYIKSCLYRKDFELLKNFGFENGLSHTASKLDEIRIY